MYLYRRQNHIKLESFVNINKKDGWGKNNSISYKINEKGLKN